MNTGNIKKDFLKELIKPTPLQHGVIRMITVTLSYFKTNILLKEVHITYMLNVRYNLQDIHFPYMSFC